MTRRDDESGRLLERLDHLVVVSGELEKARGRLALLLGRSPAWQGASPSAGTRNVIFRLANSCVELVAPEGDGPGASRLREHLDEQGPGLFALALGCADADTAWRTLSERGLAAGTPEVTLDHDEASGAFRRSRSFGLAPDATRGIGLFVVEQLSEPDTLPPSLPLDDEAGAARAVDHVVVMTREPDAALRLYGEGLGIRLALDRSFEKRGVRLIFFRLGGATIEIGAPLTDAPGSGERLGEAEADRDRLWGVAYQVPDAERAQARLVAAGFETTRVRDGHKPGTRVFTVKGEPLGVPTLMIQPVGR